MRGRAASTRPREGGLGERAMPSRSPEMLGKVRVRLPEQNVSLRREEEEAPGDQSHSQRFFEHRDCVDAEGTEMQKTLNPPSSCFRISPSPARHTTQKAST